MTPNQLEALMKRNKLRQIDLAKLFHTTPRQVRRWQNFGLPRAEATILRLLDSGKVTFDNIYAAGARA